MSIGVFTFSLWSFQAFWPPILLFFHLHLLIFLDSSLWRLKFLNRLFLHFYSVRPSTLTQNTVHYRSGSTFLMQMIAQFGFRTKNNYWLLWIIKSSDTFKLAWQLSKFTRFFPTSIGSLNLKQKLSKFRLFNLSFFSTALSNYTFPIPGCGERKLCHRNYDMLHVAYILRHFKVILINIYPKKYTKHFWAKKWHGKIVFAYTFFENFFLNQWPLRTH